MIAALVCLATQCHSPLRFEVSGDLESGVVFHVFDAQDDDRRVRADEVVIGELSGDEVWVLRGDATLRELIYGTPIEGMTTTLGPQPLERGKNYYVVVAGGDRSRGGHYGTASFSVGEDGRVGPGPPLEIPCLAEKASCPEAKE